MTSADRPRFAEVFNALAAAFNTEPTVPMLQGYWMGLESMSLADFETAARGAIETSKFFPRVADLRALAGGVTVESAALCAWDAVRKAIRSVGIYRSVDFGPLVNAVINNLGGWQRLCNEETDELDKWVRKDFERVYGVFAASGVSEEAGRHLGGLHERDNAAGGFEIEAPVTKAIEAMKRPRTDGEPMELGAIAAEGRK